MKLASNLASSVWKEGDRVVKFEINCGAVKRNNDPRRSRTALANEQTLLMEYIVSELVCKIVSGVCPEIFSISGAAEVGAEVFTSLELTTGRKDRDYCIGKSMYRQIEEEFVGPSVSELFKHVSPIERAKLAGQVLIKTIDLLEKLHEHGFIHGDIHKDNIALRDPRGGVRKGPGSDSH